MARLSFDAQREESERQMATGRALAESAYERGQRLTVEERQALTHNSRWGSTGYPVVKLSRKWTVDHPAASCFGVFATKREAVSAWETMICKWIALSGMEAQARALAGCPCGCGSSQHHQEY